MWNMVLVHRFVVVHFSFEKCIIALSCCFQTWNVPDCVFDSVLFWWVVAAVHSLFMRRTLSG